MLGRTPRQPDLVGASTHAVLPVTAALILGFSLSLMSADQSGSLAASSTHISTHTSAYLRETRCPLSFSRHADSQMYLYRICSLYAQKNTMRTCVCEASEKAAEREDLQLRCF